MNETPLIVSAGLLEESIDLNAKPAIRYRVTAKTQTGQLVLWISKSAAQELRALLAQQLDKPDSR
jgi:hypothetical protein